MCFTIYLPLFPIHFMLDTLQSCLAYRIPCPVVCLSVCLSFCLIGVVQWIFKLRHYCLLIYRYNSNILNRDPSILSTGNDRKDDFTSPDEKVRPHRKRRHTESDDVHGEGAPKKKLKFMPTVRTGMTVCADHGWQKKGFDSLTGIFYQFQSVRSFVT